MLTDRVPFPLERNYQSIKERTEMSDAATQTQMEHALGSFCWIELATTDGPGAKKFYTELFGWEAQDSPIGPDMVYTMLKLNGKDVGALFQKGEMMKDVPTHWASYVSVNSADETVAKAKSLGGTIRQEAFDVMDVGRMAVITDPTSATFCIWEPKKHKGIGVKVKGETNSLCWNELLTNDTAKAIDFYTKLFGWKTKTDSGATPYTEIINGEEHIGGIMQIQPHMGPMPPNWGIYIAVDDCDGTAQKATSLGGRQYVPPTDIPKVGRFAVLSDPQGAVFSIIKLSLEHHE
ncbi:MAG: VOC family protein [Acidobacteria bacterium]|nr:MAG: VOC family protein [Acidobacteriota bacterium]